MLKIAEFKKKNPAYANVPDPVLADKLHKKYYAKMPRADFDAAVGYSDLEEGPQQPKQQQAAARPYGPDNRNTTPFQHIRGMLAGLGDSGQRLAANLYGGVNEKLGMQQPPQQNMNETFGVTDQTPQAKFVQGAAGFAPYAPIGGASLIGQAASGGIYGLTQNRPDEENILLGPGRVNAGIENAALATVIPAGVKGAKAAWPYIDKFVPISKLPEVYNAVLNKSKKAASDLMGFLTPRETRKKMIPTIRAARRQGVHMTPGETSGEYNTLGVEGRAGFTPEGRYGLAATNNEILATETNAINNLLNEAHPESRNVNAEVQAMAARQKEGQEAALRKASKSQVDTLLKDIAPTSEGANVEARAAAQTIKAGQIKERSAQAGEHYNKARGKQIAPGLVTNLEKDANIKSAIDKVMSDPALAGFVNGQPRNSVQVLHLAKKLLDGQVKEYIQTKGAGNIYSAAHEQSAGKINALLKSRNKNYRLGSETFAEGSPQVKAVMESPIGRISDMKDSQLKGVVSSIFDRTQTDMAQFREVKRRFMAHNPELWHKIVRLHLEDRLAKGKEGDVGALFFDSFLGTAKDKRQLHEALSHSPEMVARLRQLEAQFKQNPKRLKEIKSGVVSQIATLGEKERINLSNRIFNPQHSDIKMMREVRQLVEKENPEAWGALLRDYLESSLGKGKKIVSGKNAYDTWFANDRQFNHLMAAAEGMPKVQQAFKDMRLIFKHKSNPPTMQQIKGSAKSSTDISGNRNPIQYAINLLLGKKYDKAVVELMSDPQWYKKLRVLATTNKPNETPDELKKLLNDALVAANNTNQTREQK